MLGHNLEVSSALSLPAQLHGRLSMASDKPLSVWTSQCGPSATKEPLLSPRPQTGVWKGHTRALSGMCCFLTPLTLACNMDPHWPLTHLDAFNIKLKLFLRQTPIMSFLTWDLYQISVKHHGGNKWHRQKGRERTGCRGLGHKPGSSA